jgi:hypothetical protein
MKGVVMQVKELSPQDKLMEGISFIIANSKHIDRILYSGGRHYYEVCVRLEEHPFDLPIPEDCQKISLASWLSDSDSGPRTLAVYVLERLTRAVAEHRIIYMREMFAPNREFPGGHGVFFEIMIGKEIFLCGGQSDCSGAGGAARDAMESFFSVLSCATGIEIQKVYLSIETGEIGEQYIKDVWNSYMS